MKKSVLGMCAIAAVLTALSSAPLVGQAMKEKSLSGGPCKYKGKDMKSAHMGMHVTGADLDALVEDLVGALDKFKVGEHGKHQLLSALGPMKGDIVESGR